MRNQKTKIFLAKEYLYFLKSVAIFVMLWGIINASIWTVNSIRDSKIQEKQKLILNIDSLNNIKGSQVANEKAQMALYNLIHEPEYYTKSFTDFKNQFSNDTSRLNLYNKMVEMDIYSSNYDSFMNTYFPSIDTVITNKINNLKNNKEILDGKNLSVFPFLDWKIALLTWAIFCYVFRFLSLSIRKSNEIIQQDKNDI